MTGVEFPFKTIRDERDLAQHLECEANTLLFLADPSRQHEFYAELRIPKRKRGGFRLVYRSREDVLSRIHKALAVAVADAARFRPCVQGFVKKRSIVTNARQHLGKQLLLHADIEHFFESIRLPSVISCFQSLGCRPQVAELLGRLCTRKEVLPQGAHASPVLANIACRHLDQDFEQLAEVHGCTYTRYADDLTFSGDEVPEEGNIQSILAGYGFKLRDGKCRRQQRGRGQFVTGLSVGDPVGPRIPKKMKRQLRRDLHYATRYGLEDHLRHVGRPTVDPWEEYSVLEGRTRYLASVEPKIASAMWKQLVRIRAQLDKSADTGSEEAPS
ncbi:reverse transcriptase family protein [Myxococcus landrumensis]|uniref:RNA-directed DNA polymerase n=1 Tax=Myxococcus landrumensis TaxID=2813577 RepID=A0ABX7N5T6_9BACT|nr:reverse transcriptase family protein [Myxococcus landrumus]QSQ14142.1 RNA-directed DNA polymerase [Myxococcus landrumus]